MRISKLITFALNVGVNHVDLYYQKRNVRLTNFMTLSLVSCFLIIVLFRYFSGILDAFFAATLLVEALMILCIIPLNYFGFTFFSRLMLCWFPALILVIDLAIILKNAPVPETSHYLGIRMFQIAFSFFPFIVFNLSEKWKMALAVSLPLALALLFDVILTILGVGYKDMGLTESSYYYNNFRATLSFAIIGASFLFLKWMLERQEKMNTLIIRQLDEKNRIIQANASHEIKKAHDRLKLHIETTPVAVIERDRNFNIIYWNKRAEDLFGWSAAEVYGRKPQDFLIDARDHDKAAKSMNKALNDKRVSNFMEVRTNTKNGTVLDCIWYYSFVRDDKGELETVLSFVSDITEQRRANYFLNERVKELTTLYNVSQLLTAEVESMHNVLRKLPSILPSGWQYSDRCEARIILFDNIFQSDNFTETEWMQSVDLVIDGRQVGIVSIVYVNPPQGRPTFLPEEDNLLKAIGQMLQAYVERTMEEQELRKTQANLNSVINNTEILIWSVDVNFNIIAYNEASRKFALEYYKVDVTKDKTMDSFPPPVRDRWVQRYKRVLQGEVLELEETQFGFDLKYSLSPIIENNESIGVVVFVDNVTESKRQARALAEANKKIADLKVMALRSVMNPHFVFNVLSSIQYFITKNDELNAINYLTAFSKLMRTVLTRSVADAVTLKEELDLLKDYVHLEKLRFDDKFDFIINPDQDIDLENTKIPSLLIQPYVENAILHGLYNKTGRGLLNVRVRLADDSVIFEVEDDGIGRDAAMRLKANNPMKRKSMGTQLTEERLAIINADGESPVVYTDLFKNNEACGTRVTIRIKMNPN
jgi:PAS domain S-box-containing protein